MRTLTYSIILCLCQESNAEAVQEGAAATRALLWRLCMLLPGAVGPSGRGEAPEIATGAPDLDDETHATSVRTYSSTPQGL